MRLDEVPLLSPGDFHRTIVGETGSSRIAALFGFPSSAGLRLLGALADDTQGALVPLMTDAGESFPSLTPECPQAHYFEREIFEQHGARPEGHPWLKPVRGHEVAYPMFEVEGEEIHEVAVGPVHAGLIDPGHFRLQCHGEKVMSLEIHLGYQHRGIEEALAGGPTKRSLLLAECIAGDTTLGHALAYARVMEALGGCNVPPRAQAIRAAALEIERIANHVGDLGAIGTDIGYLPTSAWLGRLRGEFLNLLAAMSGSRYGRGLIRPGGVRFDIPERQAEAARARLIRARKELEEVTALFFGTSSVRSRLEGIGALSLESCEDLGLLGPVARACGARRDVRSDHPPAGEPAPPIAVATAATGDVLARAQVRWLEAQRSLDFVIERLGSMPEGPVRADCGPPLSSSLAVSMVEGWRGEIVHVVITDSAGRFARYKVKDPSFQNWTGLSLALRGMQISDFPLCNKSFNLSYAGHDL